MSVITETKWALCLGGGIAQVPLINYAQELGWKVCVIDQNPDCVAADIADLFIAQSTYNSASVLHQVTERGLEIKALLARASGQALYTAATLDNHFKLYGLSQQLIILCTVKSKLRHFCQQIAIPTPAGHSDVSTLTNKDFPLVVRPDFPVRGKQAVALCETSNQLSTSIAAARQVSANGEADVANFVAGQDITVLAHLHQGQVQPIAWWDEINHFTQGALKAFGLMYPSLKDENLRTQLLTYVTRFAAQFPELSYVLAFSFRTNQQGQSFLIEVHADLTGDLILDTLLPASLNQQVLPQLVQGLLGGKYPNLNELPCQPALLKFTDTGPTIIKAKQALALLETPEFKREYA